MNYSRILFLLLFFVTFISNGQKNKPSGLLCELLPHPELSVITNKKPDFGWIVNSDINGDYQTAYQIQVATAPALLKANKVDLWDSGKILSEKSINVRYEGKGIEPNQSYWWRVRNWNKSDIKSSWSETQQFNTGDFDTSSSWPGESDWVEIIDSKGEKFWTFEDREPTIFHGNKPVRTHQKDDVIFYDFGKDAFAYLKLNITWNPDFGTSDSLDISVGEKVIGDSIDRAPGGSIVYENYRLPLKKGTNDYTLEIPRFVPEYPHSQVMPIQKPEVIPFRYCEIKTKPNLKINSINQKALYVLFDEDASSFSSSNEKLNEIYEMSKYSTIANTFNGDYANSNRERMMYEADCYIQQMDHYSIDRKFATARYSMKNLIHHASWPTEWIMHSVFMSWADYLYSVLPV